MRFIKVKDEKLPGQQACTRDCGCGGGNSESSPLPQAKLQKSADTAIGSGLAGIALEHLTVADTAQALAGLRQVGTAAKLQAGDAFMIGSTTMTSALAGRERCFAAWLLAQDPPPDMTPGQIFFYSNACYATAAPCWPTTANTAASPASWSSMPGAAARASASRAPRPTTAAGRWRC